MEQNGHASAAERPLKRLKLGGWTHFDTVTINCNHYCSRYLSKMQYIS